jgi:hypothetical protein
MKTKIAALALIIIAPMLLIAALSADRITAWRAGDLISLPVYQASTIYEGGMVCVNSSGYAVACSDSASLYFAGVAQGYVANSGSSGAKKIEVRTRGQFKLPATSISQAHVGSIMYIKDDQTFDNTSSNLIPCGRLVQYISSTEGWIEIQNAVTIGATLAGSAVSMADAGNHFAAANDTAEEQIQKLALQVPITVPRFTGYTKDGSTIEPATPDFELPSPVICTAFYITMGTAPGTGKTTTIYLNGSTVATIAGATTTAERESKTIAIAANTDFTWWVSETSSGSGANVDIMAYCKLDDGE